MGLLPFEEKKREVLVKKSAETDVGKGCDPNKRDVEKLIEYGIVNIDKPKGPSSHQVSDHVQKILNIKKSGHSGTLDPAVTGVLPTALGRGTRIVQALLKAGKEYICLMHLHKEVDKDKIIKISKERFTGNIKQLPPVKSAVKRRVRTRKVYYFEILEIDGQDVLFRIGCEAGTYIRKICSDFGKIIGTGAHMAELRRTKAGCFDEETIVTLQDLKDAYWYYKEKDNEKFIRHCIKPIEYAVSHLPKIWVFDSTIGSLCHGIDLKVPGISKLDSNIEPDQMIAVMTLKDELVCLATAKLASNIILRQDRGVAAKTDKVFMDPEIYEEKKNNNKIIN